MDIGTIVGNSGSEVTIPDTAPPPPPKTSKTNLIRITKITIPDGACLKVSYEKQDGQDWLSTGNKEIASMDLNIDEHLKTLKNITLRCFNADKKWLLDEITISSIDLTYAKATGKNPDPAPHDLMKISLSTKLESPETLDQKPLSLGKTTLGYSPDGSGLHGYLKSSEAIAIEQICNMLAECMSTEANKEALCVPVQLDLKLG